MRAPLRVVLRTTFCGWPKEPPLVGYDVLPVAANWGRFGLGHLLRPYWACRRFLYMMGADV